MLKKITIGAALAASTIAVVPAPAFAGQDGYYSSRYERSYRGDNHYRGRNYYRGQRRCKGTTGTIIGGAGGALLGREIAGRGSRTTGTILGAAAGALLGREIHKSSCRSRY
jgi:outer membrane lipoprotein SlyB